MKITILAVGTLKKGPEKDLISEYAGRLQWRLDIREVKSLTPDLISKDSYIISLDERGENLTSDAFARIIQSEQLEGRKSITFLIGGADGLPEVIRQTSHRLLSFGKMTWPHLLARALLVEQLYRAQQILKGHPYHRE